MLGRGKGQALQGDKTAANPVTAFTPPSLAAPGVAACVNRLAAGCQLQSQQAAVTNTNDVAGVSVNGPVSLKPAVI